jgi:hypothetical protein
MKTSGCPTIAPRSAYTFLQRMHLRLFHRSMLLVLANLATSQSAVTISITELLEVLGETLAERRRSKSNGQVWLARLILLITIQSETSPCRSRKGIRTLCNAAGIFFCIKSWEQSQLPSFPADGFPLRLRCCLKTVRFRRFANLVFRIDVDPARHMPERLVITLAGV